MALGNQGAHNVAVKIIEALASSGKIEIVGPGTSSGGSELSVQTSRGEKDAAYLASLYRNLAKGLQE